MWRFSFRGLFLSVAGYLRMTHVVVLLSQVLWSTLCGLYTCIVLSLVLRNIVNWCCYDTLRFPYDLGFGRGDVQIFDFILFFLLLLKNIEVYFVQIILWLLEFHKFWKVDLELIWWAFSRVVHLAVTHRSCKFLHYLLLFDLYFNFLSVKLQSLHSIWKARQTSFFSVFNWWVLLSA